MKKIGLMTWFQYHNYGTALQVTALSESIRKIGYETEVINYRAKSAPVTLKKASIAYETVGKICSKLKNRTFHNYSTGEREKKFIEFYDKHLSFTEKTDLLSELQRLNKKFDAFVCGSDQIWAPSCFDSHYFLDFVSDDNKKIAYAPSVGLPSIDDKYIKAQIQQLTKKIGYLSTREESGSKIIADLCGREVKTVLDPTLLLDSEQWKEFYSDESIHEDKPYMLVYMLGKNEWQWKEIYKIAEKLHLVVRIIPVFEKDLNRQGCIKSAVGPEEFLAYIKNSKYVCTDSFHGLAFSVNFHKQFTVFERFKPKDKINQNSRIYNLLDKFNLRSRLLKDNASYNMLNEVINYNDVENKRQILVNASMDFLTDALSKATASKPKAVKNNIHKDNTLCCGCGACKAVCPCNAIDVKLNKDGFYTAFVDDEKCISCGKCAKVCPYMLDRNDKLISDSQLYSFKSKSSDVLKKSSSGGAAHHIAAMLNGEGYAVAGCTFDVDSQTAKHILIEPEHSDELSKLQGSKYMQSNFACITEKLYRSDTPTVIFGTPCQIAGMRSLLKNKKKILYVDLICHGVPSYLLYKKYQDYIKDKYNFSLEKMLMIFRDKSTPWRNFSLTCKNKTKNISINKQKDMYFLAFEYGVCYSHNCYECPWREKSAADIRLGDYWGNRFKTDTTGVSEVAVITEEGKQIKDMLMRLKCADFKKQNMQDYTNVQQMINGREPVFWKAFINVLNDSENGLDTIMNQYVLPFERRRKLKASARKIYHILKGRRK